MILIFAFEMRKVEKVERIFEPGVILFEPDEDEMSNNGASIPLFWHTDRHCRTRTDPSFKVKIENIDISCQPNLSFELRNIKLSE